MGWTPRRVLLLLGGMAAFGAAYLVYARSLGWLDGLPQLPAAMLDPSDGNFQPPPRVELPTVMRLKEAFGEACPEQHTSLYSVQLQFLNGDSSVVLAATPLDHDPTSKTMTLAPFSLAVFGKPKPAHLRKPGEVAEVSTFHADKAILEFDRAIPTPNEMNKAKLLKLVLVSEPEKALPDPRRGVVTITNNQRSADPDKRLLVKTAGPLHYRDPQRHGTGAADGGPDVWTDAAVEITDRQNLPHGYDQPPAATAPSRGEDLRTPQTVAAVLDGGRLPPPTITGVGMRIHLDPPKKPGTPPPPPTDPNKKGSAGFSGVRRIEFQEKVLLNLWVDGRQGFVTGPAAAGSNPLDTAELPGEAVAAFAAAAGVVVYGDQAARLRDKALLQIDTLGPFAYDAERNVARFDVVPQADPLTPNDVQVTRVTAAGNVQKLLSQVLEIEFDNGPVANPTAAVVVPTAPKPPAPAGPSFKRLHAWASSPGRFVTLSAEAEQFIGYGNDLVHEQAVGRTLFQGAPLFVVRDKNVLTAGTTQRPAQLVAEPGPDKRQTSVVRGPGQIELFDEASKDKSLVVTWTTSLTHTKELATKQAPEADKFVFAGGATFVDLKADYRLKGDTLELWLAGGATEQVRPGEAKPQPLPKRMQATGNVTGHSADFDIAGADRLTVLFREGVRPEVKKVENPPVNTGGSPNPVATAPNPPVNTGGSPNPLPEPKKAKPPMILSARVIDTWVVRYPPKPPDPKAPKPDPTKPPAAEPGYQLERATCNGRVVVHQDPDDPAKPRGVDITAETLLIDQNADGGILTVTGADDVPAEVHFEDTSILGPKVVIDQVHNAVAVTGRGALKLPVGSDLAGNDLKESAKAKPAAPPGKPAPPAKPPTPAEPVVVMFRDGMTFNGALKRAEFVGKVHAQQGESWVVCHTLQVGFDRPVYFNKLRKTADPKPNPPVNTGGSPGPNPPVNTGGSPSPDDTPRIEVVNAYPVPEDAADDRQEGIVEFQQVDRDREKDKITRVQKLTAREIEVRSQPTQPGVATSGLTQRVVAHGPGTMRLWQAEAKEQVAPSGNAPPPKKDATPGDTEMKLTVVTFGGRMTAKEVGAGRDGGKLFQEAVFQDVIQVLSVAGNDPNEQLDKRKLPPGSVTLTCNDRLTLATYRPEKGEPKRTLKADGNASLRSDEYDGWGETITAEGSEVVFEGLGTVPARIAGRFNGDRQTGKRIFLNTKTNSYRNEGGFGGTLTPPSPKK